MKEKLDFESRLKDPESYYPPFKPDTQLSQNTI